MSEGCNELWIESSFSLTLFEKIYFHIFSFQVKRKKKSVFQPRSIFLNHFNLFGYFVKDGT